MPGGPVAAATFAELEPRIERLVDRGVTPGLGTILVGDDGASAGYIRVKQRKAEEVGFTSPHVHLPEPLVIFHQSAGSLTSQLRLDEAEDCVQETYLAALESLERYDATKAVMPWLLTKRFTATVVMICRASRWPGISSE